MKTVQRGSMTNALVRCTRHDDKATGLFELVRADIGLWVLELDHTPKFTVAEQISEITAQLQASIEQLQIIREGSADYTLHLAFDLDENKPIIYPPSLSKIASDCGFAIETYTNQNEEG